MKLALLYMPIFVLLVCCSSGNKNASDGLGEIMSLDKNLLTEQKEQLKEIEVSFIDSNSFASKNLFTDLGFIPLEKDSVIMGKIRKLVPTTNRILISDDKNLFCYDSTFNIAYVITARGKGPGEFKKLYDFSYDINTNQITLFDLSLRKSLIFDIFTGKFVHEKRIKMLFAGLNMVPLGDSAFIFSTQNICVTKELMYNLIVVDSSGTVISRNLPISKGWENIAVPLDKLRINYYNQEINFTNIGDRTLYKLDKQDMTLKAKYRFDFGKHNLVMDKLISGSNHFENVEHRSGIFYQKAEETNYIIGPYTTLESENVIMYLIKHKSNYHWGFYNKESGRNVLAKKYSGFPSSFFSNFPLASSANDIFYHLIYPVEVLTELEKIKSYSFNNDISKFEEYVDSNPYYKMFYRSLNKYDNPVLVFFRIKNF